MESGPPDGHSESFHLCHEDQLFPESEADLLLSTKTLVSGTTHYS